jgi:hypothetical protein
MNSDDQLSSSYHVLAPLENALYAHMNNQGSQMMLTRIMAILNDRLDDAQQHKDMFNQNTMQPLVFDVLREIKQKNGESFGGVSSSNRTDVDMFVLLSTDEESIVSACVCNSAPMFVRLTSLVG